MGCLLAFPTSWWQEPTIRAVRRGAGEAPAGELTLQQSGRIVEKVRFGAGFRLSSPATPRTGNDRMTRDEFVESLKQQLDELNAEVDELEAKMNDARDDARKQYEEKLAQARAEGTRARQKLEEVRDAGEDSWEDLKGEAEHAWKALRNSVNYFKSHFK
jgi:cell division protein FtsB